jgi:hypothetical protein
MATKPQRHRAKLAGVGYAALGQSGAQGEHHNGDGHEGHMLQAKKQRSRGMHNIAQVEGSHQRASEIQQVAEHQLHMGYRGHSVPGGIVKRRKRPPAEPASVGLG